MGSTRLPGKVMVDLGGKPALGYLLERLSFSNRIDEIVVSTSLNTENDLIVEYCDAHGIFHYRGPEEDVLRRMLGSLKDRKADVGVVVFGDNPLIDPRVVDRVIEQFSSVERLDFLGNDLKTTYPPGMDVEVFTVDALEDSNRLAKDQSIREHGTLYIRQNHERYSVENLEAPEELNRPDLYLGMDTEEDLLVIRKVVEEFGLRMDYSLSEIIEFLDQNKEISLINKGVFRKWRQYRGEE